MPHSAHLEQETKQVKIPTVLKQLFQWEFTF